MLGSKKKEKQLISEDDHRSSRFGFLNQDDSKYTVKNDPNDNINARLAANFTQIIDLLNQRKVLLLRKIERMYEQNSSRIEVISRGRMQDLKNEVRLLRDESISNLLDNSDRMSSTKNLLKRIIEQHNFNQFEQMQKNKGKYYYDRSSKVQNQLNNKTKKYNQMVDQMERINDKERQMLSKIQDRESEMIALLRRKESNYLRRAEQIQDQIQKFKNLIKDNKIVKDKTKKEIQVALSSIMDTLIAHQNHTTDRVGDIQNLFGGLDAAGFDKFVRQLQSIIQNKFDQRKDEKKKKAIEELLKIANGYEAYIHQLNKQRQSQTFLLEDVNEGLRNSMKMALIEKVYFQQISNDRSRLNEALKKCKNYKSMLDNFEGDRVRLSKQLSRINHMKNIFAPKLKALVSQQMRKEDLRKQLGSMMVYLTEIQKFQRKYKQFQYLDNSYGLARQAIEREMDDFASKGNLVQYKTKLSELQKLDRDYHGQKQTISGEQYERLQSRLNGQVQNLYSRYADLISAIMVQGEDSNPAQLISKLSKRLAII